MEKENSSKSKLGIIGTGMLFHTMLISFKARHEINKEAINKRFVTNNPKTIGGKLLKQLGPKSKLSNQRKKRKLLRQVPQLRRSKKFK
jgi:hypothetical protein